MRLAAECRLRARAAERDVAFEQTRRLDDVGRQQLHPRQRIGAQRDLPGERRVVVPTGRDARIDAPVFVERRAQRRGDALRIELRFELQPGVRDQVAARALAVAHSAVGRRQAHVAAPRVAHGAQLPDQLQIAMQQPRASVVARRQPRRRRARAAGDRRAHRVHVAASRRSRTTHRRLASTGTRSTARRCGRPNATSSDDRAPTAIPSSAKGAASTSVPPHCAPRLTASPDSVAPPNAVSAVRIERKAFHRAARIDDQVRNRQPRFDIARFDMQARHCHCATATCRSRAAMPRGNRPNAGASPVRSASISGVARGPRSEAVPRNTPPAPGIRSSSRNGSKRASTASVAPTRPFADARLPPSDSATSPSTSLPCNATFARASSARPRKVPRNEGASSVASNPCPSLRALPRVVSLPFDAAGERRHEVTGIEARKRRIELPCERGRPTHVALRIERAVRHARLQRVDDRVHRIAACIEDQRRAPVVAQETRLRPSPPTHPVYPRHRSPHPRPPPAHPACRPNASRAH